MTRTAGAVPYWAQLAGITYRQLDYWANMGYVRPVQNGNGGSGSPREWPLLERRIAQLIVRLRAAGFELEAAARIARDVAGWRGDTAAVRLGDRLVLEVGR